MHKTQINFIRARAVYTKVAAIAIAEEPAFDVENYTLPELDAFVEECADIHQRHAVPELRHEMEQARDAMFEWAKYKIAADCGSKAKIDTALSVFDRVNGHPLQLIELTELILTLRA